MDPRKGENIHCKATEKLKISQTVFRKWPTPVLIPVFDSEVD